VMPFARAAFTASSESAAADALIAGVTPLM